MHFLGLGRVVSLKGSFGVSSFACHGQWSPILIPPQHKVTFRVCVMDSASEKNRFLVLTEMRNLLCISSWE
jgi:hypothetical protein